MSYTTTFYLHVDDDSRSTVEQDIVTLDLEHLAEIVQYGGASFGRSGSNETLQEFAQLTKACPASRLILECWGEDEGDITRVYAHNGVNTPVQGIVTYPGAPWETA